MLPRTIDKARAQLAGTIGEYFFDCPMDRQLFATLGVTAVEFLGAVRGSAGDDGVIRWLRERGAIPSGAPLDAHNRAIAGWAPKSEEGRARFLVQREKLAPKRTDVTTWTDLIDVEEGRVPLATG